MITGGLVVTVDQERRIIERGAIAIEGSRIVDIDKTEEMVRKYSDWAHPMTRIMTPEDDGRDPFDIKWNPH